MGRLTKAGFARAKSDLGLKGKLTRKQVQRVFKRAIKKLGRSKSKGTKRASKTTRKSNPKKTKKVRRMARRYRRKRRGGGKSMTRTAFKLVRLAALVAPAAGVAMGGGSNEMKIRRGLLTYTGYDIDTGQFKMGWLAKGWMPYIGACLATYGIPKLVSIIRRL